MFASVKRLLMLFLLLAAATAGARSWKPEEVPNVQLADRSRYVSNPDGILSAAAERTIDTLCAGLRRDGIAEVAVVALDDIEGGDLFTFAVRLFDDWGVGREDVDNGLGIILVENLREIRFVTGPGLEGVLPDALCKRIQLDFMLPSFREGDYDAGMTAGVGAVAQVLRREEIDWGPEDGEADDALTAIAVGGIMLVLLALLVLLAVAAGRAQCPYCGKRKLRETASRMLTLEDGRRLLERTLVCRHCGKTVVRQTDPTDGGFGGPFIFGGGSGHGSGGSFGGGFGGGSFGGGGAGSKW